MFRAFLCWTNASAAALASRCRMSSLCCLALSHSTRTMLFPGWPGTAPFTSKALVFRFNPRSNKSRTVALCLGSLPAIRMPGNTRPGSVPAPIEPGPLWCFDPCVAGPLQPHSAIQYKQSRAACRQHHEGGTKTQRRMPQLLPSPQIWETIQLHNSPTRRDGKRFLRACSSKEANGNEYHPIQIPIAVLHRPPGPDLLYAISRHR